MPNHVVFWSNSEMTSQFNTRLSFIGFTKHVTNQVFIVLSLVQGLICIFCQGLKKILVKILVFLLNVI